MTAFEFCSALLFPALEVPKMVIIPNLRLSIAYNMLLLVTFVALVARFFLTQQYYMDLMIGADIWCVMGVKNTYNYSLLNGVYQSYATRTLCSGTDDYEYWYGESEDIDPADSTKFANFTCAPPCKSNQLTVDCLRPSMMAYPYSNSGMTNSWILSTLISQREFDSNGDETWARNKFIPTVSGLAVTLDFGFDVMLPSIWGNYPGNRKKANIVRGANTEYGHPVTRDGTKDVKITTYVLDRDGEVQQKIAFGSPIEFTLPQMLVLAGDSNWLDGFRQGEVNLKSGAKHSSPLRRVAGGEIEVLINCYDTEEVETSGFAGGYLCYLQFRFTQRGWLSHYEVRHTDNADEEIYHYGVHVVVVPGGNFHRIDMNNILLQFAFFLVMMSVPKRIMLLIMKHCLGHLSKIYRRVIYETFPLRQMVAGLITRMISSTTMFSMLCDVEGNDGEPWSGGISKASVKNRLQAILAHRHAVGLSSDDLERCVDFCFLMLYQGQKEREGGEQTNWDELITLDGFCHASCSIERMSMEHVAMLFDWSRPRGRLEKIFTPDDLRKDRLEAALWRHNLKEQGNQQAASAKSRHMKFSLMEKKADEQSAVDVEALSLERQVEASVRKQAVSIERLKDSQEEAKERMAIRLSSLDDELKKALNQLHSLQETEGLKYVQQTNATLTEASVFPAVTATSIVASSMDAATYGASEVALAVAPAIGAPAIVASSIAAPATSSEQATATDVASASAAAPPAAMAPISEEVIAVDVASTSAAAPPAVDGASASAAAAPVAMVPASSAAAAPVAMVPAAKRAVAKSASSSTSLDVPPPLPEDKRLSPPAAFKQAVAAAAGHGVSVNSINNSRANTAANRTVCGPGVVSLYHYSCTPEPPSVAPQSQESRSAPRESNMSSSDATRTGNLSHRGAPARSPHEDRESELL